MVYCGKPTGHSMRIKGRMRRLYIKGDVLKGEMFKHFIRLNKRCEGVRYSPGSFPLDWSMTIIRTGEKLSILDSIAWVHRKTKRRRK